MSAVHHLLLGHERHGITRLGRALLPAGRPHTAVPSSLHAGELAGTVLPPPAEAPRVHAHLNDDLLGPDPLAAFERLRAGRRVAVTFHDIPQPEEGAARYARRGAIYRELAERAEVVVVCSRHERAGLLACGYGGTIEVVDLPIDARPSRGLPTLPETVGVLGWVHPGKGHDLVLRAMAEAMPGGTLMALGATVPGHEADEAPLHELAADLGLSFGVTGFLSDDDLLAAAASVAVPVLAHRNISASASLGTWLTAGRAPIVADHPYAREILARCPGALTLATSLPDAIAAAARDPERTLLGPEARVGPSTDEAARAQALILDAWATR